MRHLRLLVGNSYVDQYWWDKSEPTIRRESMTGGKVDYSMDIYECSFSTGGFRGGGGDIIFYVRVYSNFVYVSPDGSKHLFPNRHVFNTSSYDIGNCSDEWVLGQDVSVGKSNSGTMELQTSLDSSGNPSHKLLLKDGRKRMTDTNGNFVTPNSDTLGRNLLDVGGDQFTQTWTIKDSNGIDQTYTFHYVNKTVTPPFPTTSTASGDPISNGTHTLRLLTRMDLPNGRSYDFSYTLPDGTDNPFGELTKINLPTGGYVRYEYSTLPGFERVRWDEFFSLWVDARRVTRRCVSADGSTEQCWQYEYPTTVQTTVTDPLGNVSDHTFEGDFYAGPLREIEVEFRDAVGNPLKHVVNDWAAEVGPIQGNQPRAKGDRFGPRLFPVGFRNWRIIRTTTTLLDTNQVSKVETDYNTYTYTFVTGTTYTDTRMNPVEVREYNFGSGLPGLLVRKTTFTYLHDSNTNYLDRHIWDRITSRKVYDGAGVLRAQTDFAYDSTPITTASGVVQHDYTNYPASMTYRGNLTETKHWRNTDGVWVITKNWYDELGNLIQTQDPGTHTTTFSYTDSWSNSVCTPVGGSGQAFVTNITDPLGHVTSSTYFSCSSLTASTTDPNSQTTSFTYDLFDRPLSESRPDSGSTTHSYDDVARIVTRTVTLEATQNITTEFSYDGLWRVTQSRLTSDPEGTVFVDTTYDALSRKETVSNPYRSTTDDTYGITTFEYDALGRVTKVIPPDGTTTSNNVTTVYSGNATTVTDQAGKKRKSETDALGRLTRVWEPDAAGSFIYETIYQYDVLDNLTQVDQKGNDSNSANWRTRSFVYNSLSQLT
ncbi:MAG: hypothetical protein ACE5MH_02590, partial [Terriglobia bacterium]